MESLVRWGTSNTPEHFPQNFCGWWNSLSSWAMCLSLSLLSVWFLVGFSPTEPLIYGNVSLNAVLFTYLPWVEIIVTKWDNWLLCSRIYQSLMPETNSFYRQRTCSSAIEGLSIRAQVWHSVRSKAPRDPGVAACSANTQTVVGTLNAANKHKLQIPTSVYLSPTCVCLSQDAWRPAAPRWLLHEHDVPDPNAVPVLLLQPPFCSGCTHWPQVSPGKVDWSHLGVSVTVECFDQT